MSARKPVLVLVGGPPGSGKTTLARRLGVELGLTVWTKDVVKEALGDAFGATGLEASRSLARPTFSIFYALLAHLIQSRVDVVAECNYRRGVSETELRPIVGRVRAIQVYCHAPLDLCVRRIEGRIARGERHPVHAERERLAEIASSADPLGWSAYAPLDLEIPTLPVETTEGYRPAYEEIVAFVQSEIGGTARTRGEDTSTVGQRDQPEPATLERAGKEPNSQRVVADFVAARALAAPIASRALDLVSEVGEAAKEILKGSSYGQTSFQPTPGWSGELADCYFSLLCLANSTGVDLDSALRAALDKYAQRLEHQGDAGSGR